CWQQGEVELEEIVLAYLGYGGAAGAAPPPAREEVAT
ncbi:MAG: hypothetical protein QOC86_1058, partial [Gaiellales bacterium]|nr:hypothetical protein [Gaiellales bacterium]